MSARLFRAPSANVEAFYEMASVCGSYEGEMLRRVALFLCVTEEQARVILTERDLDARHALLDEAEEYIGEMQASIGD